MKHSILQNEGLIIFVRGKHKIWSLICGATLFCFFLLLYFIWEQDIRTLHVSFDFQRNKKREEKPDERARDDFVISQQGCRIPGMTLTGPALAHYMETVESQYCEFRKITKEDQKGDRWLPPLVQDTTNVLAVDRSALKYYGKKQVHCTYRGFHRQAVSTSNECTDVDYIAKYSNDTQILNFNTNAKINSESEEFIEVKCTEKHKATNKKRNNDVYYQDYFAFVPLKKDVEERCQKIDQVSNTDRISVMIIGLDALSRLNFHRQMKLSSAYLMDKMGAIEMVGYNKIGDNTFPNLIPALTGLSVDEIKKICWPSNNVFDECPFIWKQFREYGYRTIFAEDSPSIGVFHYGKKGFCRQPTDYYLRPFYIEAETNIGFKKPANCYLCLGPRLSLSVLLNYAYKHADTWKQKKFFGFFWSTSFTHDFFNLPPQGDEEVLQFLKRFYENSSSNNTVLVVMSDHGLRWGNFRETYQGHLEERLPLLTFVFPSWFQQKYKKAIQNLRRNAVTLTTHYDLHETLFDLMNLTAIENGEIENRKVAENSRSQSLFLPVKGTRKCPSAGIPKNYCTCHDQVETLENDDPRSLKAADVLVSHINSLLRDHEECAELQLEAIEQVSAELSTMGGKFMLNHTTSNLVLTVKTIPGNALFEGNIKYEPSSSIYRVIGQVSRINTYGSQSFCIHDYILKLYCYCKI